MPPSMHEAPSNARSSPSSRRACAPRSSACDSRSTTRSLLPPRYRPGPAALAATVADLQARLDEVNARVTQGTALPAEAAAIEATLLQRRQDEDELRTNREAALARLAILIGQPLRDGDVLPLPNVVETVARAQQASAAVRSRPEYEQFARTRDRLGRQAELTKAQERPRVWTFGKVAYGLPGLNFIESEWEVYGFGGVRVEWKAWTWGTAAREREALAIGQQIVAADQAAFDRGLLESTAVDRASMERLQHALTVDERIVALREQVARSTQIRLQEGVVTASEYLDRQAELLQARFARARTRGRACAGERTPAHDAWTGGAVMRASTPRRPARVHGVGLREARRTRRLRQRRSHRGRRLGAGGRAAHDVRAAGGPDDRRRRGRRRGGLRRARAPARSGGGAARHERVARDRGGAAGSRASRRSARRRRRSATPRRPRPRRWPVSSRSPGAPTSARSGSSRSRRPPRSSSIRPNATFGCWNTRSRRRTSRSRRRRGRSPRTPDRSPRSGRSRRPPRSR